MNTNDVRTELYAHEVAEMGWVKTMEHAGFKASLMKTVRLTGNGTHTLPPGERVPVFPITALPGAPSEWVREAGTYVCPVEVNWGLWFDWTMNSRLNVAVLPSVKGMNPITGTELESLHLEQYADRCPKHDEAFTHGRLCGSCGYEWPGQNYVSTPNTLWWDGFRQPDGTVRQFFFSEDERCDIASTVLGKQNTVPAFGFAFYHRKNPVTEPSTVVRSVLPWVSPQLPLPVVVDYEDSSHRSSLKVWSVCDSTSAKTTQRKVFTASLFSRQAEQDSVVVSSAVRSENVARTRKGVAVGAGVRIRQELQDDVVGLDGWLPEPAAVIRLYFCFPEQLQLFVDRGGVVDLRGDDEGYLKNLPTG